MSKISLPAYAKINLFLDISSRKENGYHNIVSYMQSISLHDTITVSYCEDKEKSIEIVCNDPCVPCNAENLVYKIAYAFPIVGKISIEIEKRIPMAAGLAGGSTDAAATIIAMNELAGHIMNKEEMISFSASFGADIPFCLIGGACIATGIGDILSETASMPDYPIIVAKIGEGMSTPLAYKKLDTLYNNFETYKWKEDKLNLLQNIDNKNTVYDFCNGMYNVFESVVEKERPGVAMLKKTMLECGAVKAMMSGSGTAVFGVFADEQSIKAAFERLASLGAETHICRRQKKSPHF